MWNHHQLRDLELKKLLLHKQIILGGNSRLKIYGLLSCSSGKRMRKENRVFFTSEEEAIQLGYRPCGHCIPKSYSDWKFSLSKKQVENAPGLSEY